MITVQAMMDRRARIEYMVACCKVGKQLGLVVVLYLFKIAWCPEMN